MPADGVRARSDRLAALHAFDTWLISFRRGEYAPISEGVHLARARRSELKTLIATDPRAALAHAVARPLRPELPPEIQAELETPIDAFGRYTIGVTCFGATETLTRTAEIDGRHFNAHVFGRRTAILSKDRLPIHGIAVDRELAIDDAPFRTLDAAESGFEPTRPGDRHVAVGSDRQAFSSAEDLDQWQARVLAAESSPGPATAAVTTAWTHGEKSVLWIRAEFADDPGLPVTDAAIEASMAEVDQFYRDVSRGRCSLRTIVLPGVVRLSRPKAAFMNNEASYTQIESEALALARSYDAANGNVGRYNPDRADRYIVIAKSVESFGFLGIASVGRSGAFLNGTVASDVVAHELGHNHGLFHSHAWRPTGSSPIGAGTHEAYGDVFDDMGNTARVPAGHFNTKQKDNLLYLDAGQVTTVTTDGTYRIFRHDHGASAGVQALRISAGDYEFWLEHRQQSPRPDFPEVNRLRAGLQLRWSRYPSSLTGTGTYLLDTTPLSVGAMNDSPLITGETFRDVTGGLSITPVARGGESPREWIDVRVAYGSTSSGNRNPVLAASVPYTVVPARTDLTFTASASDPDGDPTVVRWDFGDGQALTVGATVTRRFLKGGSPSVVCSAIDGRGGLATRTFNLVVDDPFLNWTRRGENLGTGSFYTVIHDGRQFIAAGPANLATSPDGTTWSRRTAMPGFYPWQIAVAGSSYVAAGYTPGNQSIGLLAHSSDGVTWRVAPSPAPLPEMYSVAFGAGRFVAVGKAGALLHSIDGATWSATTPLTTRDLRDVHFANGRFVISGDAGVVLVSPDGLGWTNRSIATVATLTYVVFHRDKWIAGNGSNLWTSPDADTWTSLPNSTARSGLNRMVSLGSDGVLAPASNDTVYMSMDGITWESTPVITPTTTNSLRAAAAANGTVVLVSTGGRIFQARTRSPVATPPQVAVNPQPQFVPIGQNITFSVGAPVVGTSYQWARNGEPIEGATNATLDLSDVQPSSNGSYTAVLTNFSGSTTAPAATLTVDPNTARLVNLSIRSRTGSGADIFTIGFVVARSFYTVAASSAVKSMLTRGIGPALTTFGVPGALGDPRIEFFDGATRFGSNDDWSTGTTAVATMTDTFKRVGAFELAPASKDAALLTSFAPKAYTVQVTGAGGTAGIALAELYDLDTSVTGTRLVNVSARGAIGGSDILIGGFVLSGAGQRTVLIRAIGPGLTAFGVAGALGQPVVTLFSGEQTIAANTGWTSGANVVGVRAAAARVGAFPLAEPSGDSALLATLPAGAYTLQVSGAAGSSGVALLEIYEVP